MKNVRIASVALCCVTIGLVGLTSPGADSLLYDAARASRSQWLSDASWHKGKAEWALYDAVRPIYGKPRHYEATIYTNKQYMNPETTTKATSQKVAGAFEVFKHNISELIETENYTYRFLTTSFVRTDNLQPYKLAASTQEDCGSTYKQFVVDGLTVDARSMCYFPNAGEASKRSRLEHDIAAIRTHDDLTLSLRNYPFDAQDKPVLSIQLLPDQTDTHESSMQFTPATVSYIARETVSVPYGSVTTHHLRVSHARDGGTTESHYWFAADQNMRHVLVQYKGPYGVEYKLKELDWWAYWDRTQPRP